MFSEKLLKRLLTQLNTIDNLRAEVVITAIEQLRDDKDAKRMSTEVGTWLINHSTFDISISENWKKSLKNILLLFYKKNLLRMEDIDRYFGHCMESGRNLTWVHMALTFVEVCMAEKIAAFFDYPKTFSTITNSANTFVANGPFTEMKNKIQETLTRLKLLQHQFDSQKGALTAGSDVSTANGGGGGGNVSPQVASQPSSLNQTMRDHISNLLGHWIKNWQSINEQNFPAFLQHMYQYGVLKNEEIDKFFSISVEMCVFHCLKSAAQPTSAVAPAVLVLQYTVIDALGKLFVLLMRHSEREHPIEFSNLSVHCF